MLAILRALHRRIAFVLLPALALALATPALAAESAPELRVLTESFPPFNYQDDAGKLTGQSTEVVEALLERLEREDPIALMPWAEAYEIATAESNVVLYSTARTKERELQFGWVGPIAAYHHAFYGRADKPRSIRSLEDARAAGRIGVVRDTARHEFLQQNRFADLALYSSEEAMFEALAAGNVALVLGSSDSVALAAERAGLGPFSISEQYPVQEVPLYIAMSRGTPGQELKRWQDALEAMKRDGSYDAILQRWGHHLELSPGIGSGLVSVDGHAVARLFASLVDTTLAQRLQALEALAETPDVRAGNWEQIQPLLVAQEEALGAARYWHLLPDGRYYTTVDGLATASLKDRSYFADLMEGLPTYGAFVRSRSTGRDAAVVAAPILNDDKVVGALGASIYLRDLSADILRHISAPPRTLFFAVDDAGVITLHPDAARIGMQASDIDSALVRLHETTDGEVSFTHNGRTYRAAWATALLSGWRAVVARLEE